jgi:hypothetical protein
VNTSFPLLLKQSLRFGVQGVLAAETAVLVHFKTIRRVLLVFYGVVVSLLAFVASECDLYSHFGTSNSIASLF